MPLDDLKIRANERKPNSMLEVSEAELRELAQSNAAHPAAEVFIKSADRRKRENERAAEMGGTQKNHDLIVDREDVLGILQNKEVIRERVLVEQPDGSKVHEIQKRLGESLSKHPVPKPNE